MGKWRDVKPSECIKWRASIMYTFCDSGSIDDVVQNLSWIDLESFVEEWGSSYFSGIHLHLNDYVCSLPRI
jgi:hypothetical protein